MSVEGTLPSLPMKFPAIVGLGILFSILSATAAPREWTDHATGRKVTGEFVSLDGDQVTLSINGKEYKLPVAKLSPDDQAYLKVVGEMPAPAPAATPEAAPAASTKSTSKVQGPVEVDGSSYYYYIPASAPAGVKLPLLTYTGSLGADANTVKSMIEGAEICGWMVACCVQSSNRVDPELNQTHLAKVVKHMVANQPVDPKRLYFSGHSGGARMAFRGCKRLDGAGVIAYIAGAQDDEISRTDRYFIISGATDYNRYDTATTFAAARKVSAYRLHTSGHNNGPGWLMTEGMMWLQSFWDVDTQNTAPSRAAFEAASIAWIEKTTASAPHRAAWWARFLKTQGVSAPHQAKIASLDVELSQTPSNEAYIKGIADIEEFADDVLAKISIYSEKGHTTPEIQKKCDKMLETHAETPWIKEIFTALKDKTGN
jgi:poly(3-hydroxybutyrate) depolymerase